MPVFPAIVSCAVLADISIGETTTGNDTLAHGYVNGQYVNTTTTRTGNTTCTYGTVGDNYISTTSSRIGNSEITDGYVGNDYVNITTTRIGNTRYTNGTIDDSDFSSSLTERMRNNEYELQRHVRQDRQIDALNAHAANIGVSPYRRDFWGRGDTDAAAANLAQQKKWKEERERNRTAYDAETKQIHDRQRALHPEMYGDQDAMLKQLQYNAAKYDESVQMYYDVKYLEGRNKVASIQNILKKQRAEAVGLASALENSGRATPEAITIMQQNMGLDGQDSWIQEAEIDKNGKFNIMFGTRNTFRDPKTLKKVEKVSYTPANDDGLDARSQLMLSYAYPDMFEKTRSALEQNYKSQNKNWLPRDMDKIRTEGEQMIQKMFGDWDSAPKK